MLAILRDHGDDGLDSQHRRRIDLPNNISSDDFSALLRFVYPGYAANFHTREIEQCIGDLNYLISLFRELFRCVE